MEVHVHLKNALKAELETEGFRLATIFGLPPTPQTGDIFECCFKAQSSKLERLFSLKRGKRDIRALSFELSKMSLHVGLAVQILFLEEKLMHVRKKTVVVVVVVSLLIQ